MDLEGLNESSVKWHIKWWGPAGFGKCCQFSVDLGRFGQPGRFLCILKFSMNLKGFTWISSDFDGFTMDLNKLGGIWKDLKDFSRI